MLSVHADLSISVCLQPHVPAYLEPFGREHKERFPILLEQYPDGDLLFIMEFGGFLFMPQEQLLVIFFNLCKMRHWYKQVCTVIIHLALHVSFFPAGVGITETHPEMVVGTEAGKEFRFVDGVANPPSDASCIVKDQQRRYAAINSRYPEALADTFGSFTAKDLAVAIVTVRE